MHMENKDMKKGSVYLVGAGCGQGLITAAGLDILKKADAVVYDDLIDTSLLLQAPEQSEKIYAGKRYGRHSMPQDEINQLLVKKASEGLMVVRLKGGDSFVFGRGAEEYAAVTAAGYGCTVIPGISSCIAVPEHAGIPVTSRGTARSFTVITGHTYSGDGEDYEALAHLKGTLVFLMGLHSCRQISDELIRYGKSPDTPAAVISRGFSPDEKRYDTTLVHLADTAEQAAAPAVIVIGQTASMHLAQSDGRLFDGIKITVTGSASFADKTASQLKKYGASADALTVMRIVPEGNVYPADTEKFDWLVFTSSNGVRIWYDKFIAAGCDIRTLAQCRFACIGTGTADTLKERGITADFIPTEYTSRALGRELAHLISDESKHHSSRVLILRASAGSAALTEELHQAGIDYEDRAIYDTVPADIASQSMKDSDYIVFGSAGGVEAVRHSDSNILNSGISEKTVFVCIGRLTAERLRQYTDRRIITAREYTSSGILDAIAEDMLK